MSRELVEAGFCDFVKAALAGTPEFFLGVGKEFPFYVSAETGEMARTCMGFEMPECQRLTPRTRVGSGILQIGIETQADDKQTEAQHAARCDALEALLEDRVAVRAAINAQGKVYLYGFSVGGGGRQIKDRAWTTIYDLKVGFGPVG